MFLVTSNQKMKILGILLIQVIAVNVVVFVLDLSLKVLVDRLTKELGTSGYFVNLNSVVLGYAKLMKLKQLM
jgi:hypothetical protein